MAYDFDLEQRVDKVVAGWQLSVPKKKMFGGLGYFINGNMAFGIKQSELIVKTTEEQGNELLKQPGMRHFQMGDRVSMKNWYLANEKAIVDDTKLKQLLEISRDYTLTLPTKK